MSARGALPLLLALLSSSACGKAVKPMAVAVSGSEATGGSEGSGSGSGSSGSSSAGGASRCAETTTPQPGPAPLTRLSDLELQRSMTAAVGGLAVAKVDSAALDFQTQVQGAAHFRWLEGVHHVAHEAALAFSRDEAAIAEASGCAAAELAESGCRDRFIAGFLRRAFRRPATDEDMSDMRAVFVEGQRLGGDDASGVRAVVEVALQSPELVYLFSVGQASAEPGVVALTSHERAARLSYFLTGSPPDQELSAASDASALDDEALAEHARRLLGGELNREQVRTHYQELYRLRANIVTDDAEFATELLPLAHVETSRFIDHVTFDGEGTFEALLLDSTSWVNEPLARFYGVSGVSGTEFSRVDLDPSRRGGLFTRALFLATSSPPDRTSPVMRGLGVLSRLLCYQMPPPPEGISLEPPAQLPSPATTRQRLSAATAPAGCQECHRDIDPIGFAFEHYDHVGRWRDDELGLPIDASGELSLTDARGPFRDALELLTRIAASRDAKACFVDEWLKRALRRELTAGDDCTRERLSAAFAADEGKVVSLLAAVAASDNFRYRAKTELEP